MADYSYKIGGCDVKFPHKAYGTQLSFMSKVIQALEQKHNALLEAPTGSGKTLSLLCSALAWQQRQKQRTEEGRSRLAKEMAAKQRAQEEGSVPLDGAPDAPAAATSPRPCPPDAATELASDFSISQDLANGFGAARAAIAVTDAAPLPDNGYFPSDHPAAAPDTLPEFPEPPKIFYATRTHSQIAQVVRELKRSGFTPSMTVLASKQHYCVNPHALNSKDGIQAACDDMMKGGKERNEEDEPVGRCEYYQGVVTALEGGRHNGLTTEIHDIEDLTAAAKEHTFCPYFVARKLATGADLVFGPYSYFIDPVIRRSMGVDVENAVVIFDEAHNIEDVSREAASLELERQQAWETLKALCTAEQYNPAGREKNLYRPLIRLMGAVLDWMDEEEKLLEAQGGGQARGRYEDPQERVVDGQVMMAALVRMGLGPGTIDTLWESYEEVRASDEEMLASKRSGARGPGSGPDVAPGAENGPLAQEGGPPKPAGKAGKSVPVGSGPLGNVSRLIQVVRMLHQMSENGGRDFRLVSRRAPMPPGTIVRSQRSQRRLEYDEGEIAKSDLELCKRSPPAATHLLHMSLWCLNPAVAFRQVATPAHSVILTSGTLSPLDSFASELGAPFQTRLEAPHVVNMARQVWAGVVPAAPDGRRLLATYAHTSKPEFLESVGWTVTEACAAIPDGVLLFLPSYALLDRCVQQWQRNGTWKRLAGLKSALVVEPRRGGGPALQEAMDDYYGGVASGRGALMVAVCRGKVSEGLDFADANARGVLVVGIPFPNLKDKKVEAKRAFNDEGARTMGLLSGSVWYEQQAFRALNQAIGRCIRHRADWGAIVLIDERFGQAKTQRGLSKWVQRSVGVHRNFNEARASMGEFFARLAAEPPTPLPGAGPAGAAPPARHGRTVGAPLNALQLLMNGAKVEMDVLGEDGEDAGAAGAAGGAPALPLPGPAERLTPADAAVRKAPLHSYVTQDLEFRAGIATSQFPGIQPFDAAAHAVAAILATFDTAAAVASSVNPFHAWAGADGVMPPWGVIAVLSTVPHTLPPAVLAARHPSIIDFAAVHLANLNVVTALEAMRGAYEEVFQAMGLGAAVEAAWQRRAVAAVKEELQGPEGGQCARMKRKREEDGEGAGPGWVPAAGAGF